MIKVEIPNRIVLQWDGEVFKCSGPVDLLEKVEALRKQYGDDPKNWPAPEMNASPQSSVVVLFKFIQKVKRVWNLPYPHEELCHCRLVPTEKVTCAIEQGAKTVSEIARVTMAGTGCGTCRSDSEELLAFYKQTYQQTLKAN